MSAFRIRSNALHDVRLERVLSSLQAIKPNNIPNNVIHFTPVENREACLKAQEHLQRPLEIGLAISGGVDSMALALLCSNIQKAADGQVQFRAFVVDHGVRAGSHKEADSVADRLRSRNIATDVLTIQWPSKESPKGAANFETLARRYRFQALGRACRSHGIRSLFLAHHSDDQAETVLMRLCKSHKKRGLRGMELSAPIPECHGIYGVGSGAVEISDAFNASPIVDGQGGVRIYRPLLALDKATLRDFCEKSGFDWFEDATNADPGLTMRNAVRHLYQNYRLPAALQKRSLLAMVERLRKERDRLAETVNERWAEKFDVVQHEPNVPLVVIRTNPLSADEVRDPEAFAGVLEVVRGVVPKISCKESIPLQTLASAVPKLFPELQPCGDAKWHGNAFTLAGVQFRRVQSESGLESDRWILQPQKANRGKAPCLVFRPTTVVHQEALHDCPDEWVLYESTFWIKVLNTSEHVIRIRPLYSLIGEPLKKLPIVSQLERTLSLRGSSMQLSDIWAIPTLTCDGAGQEKIIGFPTLKLIDDEYRESVLCEAQYSSNGSRP